MGESRTWTPRCCCVTSWVSPERPSSRTRERRLTPEEVERYQALVERRARAEPVAYLTGEREFMGLTFAVDRRTLIPRPETETLVERALQLLSGRPALAVDVGTGSGAIAVSVAALAPAPAALRVVGIDRSWEALQVGRANAARLLPAGRARPLFLQSSLLSGVRGPFDLVLANLPYVAAADAGGVTGAGGPL